MELTPLLRCWPEKAGFSDSGNTVTVSTKPRTSNVDTVETIEPS